MVVDNINAIFEVTGGVFVFLNVLKLYHDKEVRGVSYIGVAFFVMWGYWNLYYYSVMGQYRSAIGTLSVAVGNTVWLGQMIYYIRKEIHDDRA